MGWFKRETKEEKEKKAQVEKALHVEEQKSYVHNLNTSLSRYLNKYCLDKRGNIYAFTKVVYNEEKDRVEYLTIAPDTQDGHYTYMDGSLNWVSTIKRDRERWEQFKADADKLGLEIIKK